MTTWFDWRPFIRLLEVEYDDLPQPYLNRKHGPDEHPLAKVVKRRDVAAVQQLLNHRRIVCLLCDRRLKGNAEESGADEIVRLLKVHISSSPPANSMQMPRHQVAITVLSSCR